MPVEMRGTDNGLGVIVTGSGVVTEVEYLDFYRKVLSQDTAESMEYVYSIHDYSEVASVSISTSAVSEIAGYSKKAAEISPNRVTAIVAGQDVIFGLARMWELLSGGLQSQVRVFRDRKDAEVWIRQQVKDTFQIDGLTFR